MNERASFFCDTSGGTVIVYIRGEIDHHTAVSVRNGIDAMLFERRPQRMILDLSSVGFMDSSGLGLIMGRLSVVKSLGGDMVVRDPSPETESILSLAGMERLVQIEYTESGRAYTMNETGIRSKKKYVPPETTVTSTARNTPNGSPDNGKLPKTDVSKRGTRKRTKVSSTSA